MLRTFIFDDSKSHWVEEEHNLLLNDICVILDEEKECIYLWKGPRSNKRRYREGFKYVKELITYFPNMNLQFVQSKKKFPQEIQERLNSMLEPEEPHNLLFSRLITIRLYLIFLLGAILIPLISLLNLSSSLFWPVSNGISAVNSKTFELWIFISEGLTLTAIILFVVNIIIGIVELENQVITFSIAGLIINIGLFIYYTFGIYLFWFQAGSTFTTFLILKNDILIFLFINITLILIFEIPNIYKLISFLKSYRKFIF
jgi:hypothetical protein